jgi:hypothetical protein
MYSKYSACFLFAGRGLINIAALGISRPLSSHSWCTQTSSSTEHSKFLRLSRDLVQRPRPYWVIRCIESTPGLGVYI